jgi:predicted alpha/beta superfamily hydrolase
MTMPWTTLVAGAFVAVVMPMTPMSPLISQSVARDAASASLLPGIEEHVLRSTINDREYHIFVALTPGYSAADTTRYPVLYLLDGRLELPLFTSMLRQPNRLGADGNVILVGISYAPGPRPGEPAPGGGQIPYRLRDYSPPVRNDSSSTAGAPKFLRVIREQIIPLVERTYRTNGDRGLHGFSMGGLFAAYVLFEDPETFSRYGMTSASLWFDGGAIFQREARSRRSRTSLRKTVFLGVGAAELPEMIDGTWRLASALCEGIAQHNYDGLTLTVEMFAGEGHFSTVPFSRTLDALYPTSEQRSGARRDPCTGRR